MKIFNYHIMVNTQNAHKTLILMARHLKCHNFLDSTSHHQTRGRQTEICPSSISTSQEPAADSELISGQQPSNQEHWSDPHARDKSNLGGPRITVRSFQAL